MTDIMGWEDAFGDMDCKIAGTEKGITGFQLDLKLKGVPLSIIAEALQKTRAARLKILKLMKECISAPRSEISKYAPRIVSLKIPEDKIGALIGPGGKNIKALCDESGCEINIDDDGTVRIYGTNKEGIDIARTAVEALSAEIKVGEIYRGKVVSIKDFGCFVEVLPGKEGLCEVASFKESEMLLNSVVGIAGLHTIGKLTCIVDAAMSGTTFLGGDDHHTGHGTCTVD